MLSNRQMRQTILEPTDQLQHQLKRAQVPSLVKKLRNPQAVPGRPKKIVPESNQASLSLAINLQKIQEENKKQFIGTTDILLDTLPISLTNKQHFELKDESVINLKRLKSSNNRMQCMGIFFEYLSKDIFGQKMNKNIQSAKLKKKKKLSTKNFITSKTVLQK